MHWKWVSRPCLWRWRIPLQEWVRTFFLSSLTQQRGYVRLPPHKLFPSLFSLPSPLQWWVYAALSFLSFLIYPHLWVHPRLNLAFNAFQICSYYVFISNFRKLTGTDSWPWWRKTSWSSLTTKLDLAWRSKTSSGFWRLEWTRLRQGFKPPWHESLRSLPSALNAFPVRLVPTATYCCLS